MSYRTPRLALALLPLKPGITQADPTATQAAAAQAGAARSTKTASRRSRRTRDAREVSAGDRQKPTTRTNAADSLRRRIEQTLGIHLPSAVPPTLPSAGQSAPQAPNTADPQQLLDFLLGP